MRHLWRRRAGSGSTFAIAFLVCALKGGDDDASAAVTFVPSKSTTQQQQQPKSRTAAAQKSPAPPASEGKCKSKGNGKGAATPDRASGSQPSGQNATMASSAQQTRKPQTGRGVVYAELEKLEGAPRKGDRLAFKVRIAVTPCIWGSSGLALFGSCFGPHAR